MASIIQDYEYDIFISYRQKDNKGDRWVSEFVDALKTELESTFKEEISVYFDINPHDGILDTYDVDASLKDKLRCLVFIPIISRTYCDPKSFAWEHEFKAFIEQALKDQFGLKVKLPNGNVASRILPVQIHDLYPEDRATIEKELSGVLRAVEFIYKEPGVNRPLTAADDKEINLNKTKFRNQINKVAIAIEEVIHGLVSVDTSQVLMKSAFEKPLSGANEEALTKELSKTAIINWRYKKWMIILLSVVICITGVFKIYKLIEGGKKVDDIAKLEKSIAVLPFTNLSNDPEQGYLSEGMREEILNHLFKIGGLKISSSFSTMRFRESKLSIREISQDLKVSYVLEGNVRKSGKNLTVIVRLINGKNEKLVWTDDYHGSITATSILEIQSEVALQVAENLKVVINPEVKKRIKARPTENTEAYSLYLQAWKSSVDSLNQRMKMLERAILLDPNFADAYALLAYWRMWYMGDSLTRDQILEKVEPLLNKALQLDNNSIVAHNVLAELRMWYYWDLEAVEKDLEIIKQLSPSNGEVLFGFVQYLWVMGKTQEAFALCKDFFDKNEIVDEKWVFMALAYDYIGKQKKAIEIIESALRLFPNNDWIYSHAIGIFVDADRYEDAVVLFEKNTAGKGLKDLEDDILGPMGIAYYRTGNKSKANMILNELLSRNRIFARNQSSGTAAGIYVAMGQKDKAIQCLEKAYARHELGLVALKNDPGFKTLHGDPRFENLLLKIGLK